MRLLATAFALVLTTTAAGAHVDPDLRRLAETASRSPTGGAVLGTPSADEGPCLDTLTDTRCGAKAALAAYVRREIEIANLTEGWNAPALKALDTLRRAEHGYAAAIARNEVDRRGTDGEDQAEAAAEAQDETFVSLLRNSVGETGRAVSVDTPPNEADATLNQTYRLVMAEPIANASVTRDGVRQTQRAWLAYRVAFVALATALERPTAPLATELTAARTRDLEGLIAD